ncbi:hypothetical protein GUJ93_ZPchr0001g30187 [Zizania palustris]|uniref:PA domain-containing protein n=1 Tax=Zizania palustris TaxID=103762 RepID=A0A8J5RR70_ZIZPA|nr:hypothetical protein GUJ93_ZPchr0001g30187 [Zizania palustris]
MAASTRWCSGPRSPAGTRRCLRQGNHHHTISHLAPKNSTFFHGGRKSRADLITLPAIANAYSNCYPGSLDPQKAAGKIVVCVGTDPMVSRRVKKLVAEGAGARGLVLIDDTEKAVPFVAGGFPFSHVGTDAGAEILGYMNSTK